MSTKSLDPKRKAAVQRFLRRVVEERFGGSQTAAAKALGVSQPYVADILKDAAGGGGVKIVFALADATHTLVDRIFGRELTDLDVALDYHRGRFGDLAVEQARQLVDRGERRSPREWAQWLEVWERENPVEDGERLIAEIESSKVETKGRRRRA